MSQDSNFFAGQPAFKQIVDLVDKELVLHLVAKYNSDRYVKRLKTYAHLIVMLYGVMSGCNSLRELVLGLTVRANRLRHLGLDCRPPRSTLSDASKRRGSDLFGDLYMLLYDKYSRFLSDSRSSNRREHRKQQPVKAQAELPAEVFLRRQRKRNRNTGLVRAHSVSIDDGVQGDERNRENVILQHDVRYPVYSYGICAAPHGADRAGENIGENIL